MTHYSAYWSWQPYPVLPDDKIRAFVKCEFDELCRPRGIVFMIGGVDIWSSLNNEAKLNVVMDLAQMCQQHKQNMEGMRDATERT